LAAATPGQGNPSATRTGGLVAFQRAGDVWALDLTTGRAVNLTQTEVYEGCPWPSAEGSLIAFDGIRAGRSEIFVIRRDGSGLRQLTRGPGNSACPAFSADGQRIAFVSDRDGEMDIYLLDLATGADRRLTDDPAADMDPAFSPDGQRIAFTSDRRGKFEIYEMQLDGSGLRRLTEAVDFDIQPVYSPDGRWIAFERDGNIAAVHRETGRLWGVTDGPEYKGGPTWGSAPGPPR
jgi:TolB protein